MLWCCRGGRGKAYLDVQPLVENSENVVVLVVVKEAGEEVKGLLADPDGCPGMPKLARHGVVVDVLLGPQLPQLLELLHAARDGHLLDEPAIGVEELLELRRLLQVYQIQETVDEDRVKQPLEVLLSRAFEECGEVRSDGMRSEGLTRAHAEKQAELCQYSLARRGKSAAPRWGPFLPRQNPPCICL